MMGGSADRGVGDEGWGGADRVGGSGCGVRCAVCGVRCAGSEMGSLLLGCCELGGYGGSDGGGGVGSSVLRVLDRWKVE